MYIDYTQMQSVKFLGMHLHSQLTFSKHIYHIAATISKGIGLIYKLNSMLPVPVLKSLYILH